jgi:DNA-binding GntR family transcriptional regulator
MPPNPSSLDHSASTGRKSRSDHLPRLQHASISDQAYEVLKQGIFSRHFTAGQRLDLTEIEEQMGISRTPLREAINRLALEGLVKTVPRSGTYVTVPSRRDIAELFEVRQILEVHAIGLAVDRITEEQIDRLTEIVRRMRDAVDVTDRTQTYSEYTELDHAFHRLIVESAGNKHLREVWEQVNVHVQMARIRYRRTDRELDISMAQHEEILQTFSERDPTLLRELMGRHIERAKQALLRDLDELGTLEGSSRAASE